MDPNEESHDPSSHSSPGACLQAKTALAIRSTLKALANEDTLWRTHFRRHKCFPVYPRAKHLLRTQILCPKQMFPSLRSPRNVMGSNVSATMCPRLLWLYYSMSTRNSITRAVASNKPTEALASVISFAFVVYSHHKHS